jgi:hypothetical protein
MLAWTRRRRSRLVIVAVLAALPFVLGHPATAQASGDGPETEEPGAPGEAETANRITIAIGSMRQDVDGNALRFRQYVTPPSATHIALLEVLHPLDDAGVTFGGYAYDLLEPSAGGIGYLYEVDQGLRFDTRYRRSQFYRSFYQGTNHLRRKDWKTDFRWRVTGDDYLAGHYSTLSLRGGDADDTDSRWLREHWSLDYTRTLGPLNASAAYSFEQFAFADPSPYLTGETSTWGVSLSPARDARTLVAAAFSASSTDLEGELLNPEQRVASLSALHQLTPDLN